MFELKPITRESLPSAIEKAERYRMLNEPLEAESICRDVLELEPDNQRVLTILLLALTDQFQERLEPNLGAAQQALARLADDYSRRYYAGIIDERRAKSCLSRGGPRSGHVAYHWLRRAMEQFEEAAAIRPAGNDDAILRWNTCARMIDLYPRIEPDSHDGEQPLE